MGWSDLSIPHQKLRVRYYNTLTKAVVRANRDRKDVTFYSYQLTIIALISYQNDVTFYAYQPPPPSNDVTIDAYQPDNIAINAYQVCKKNEIGYSQNNLLIGVRSVRLEFLLPLKTNSFPFRFIRFMLEMKMGPLLGRQSCHCLIFPTAFVTVSIVHIVGIVRVHILDPKP